MYGRSNANSTKKIWNTPQKYVDAVRQVLGTIYLDPCSNEHSIVNAVTEYSLPETDGLKASWNYPTIYVNPPYGSDRFRGTSIKNWLARCAAAHKDYNSEVLALVCVAPNTHHWKDHVWQEATGVCFLGDTRLKFLIEGGEEGKGSPLACAMIYWGYYSEKFFEVFSEFGYVVDLKTTKLYAERYK